MLSCKINGDAEKALHLSSIFAECRSLFKLDAAVSASTYTEGTFYVLINVMPHNK